MEEEIGENRIKDPGVSLLEAAIREETDEQRSSPDDSESDSFLELFAAELEGTAPTLKLCEDGGKVLLVEDLCRLILSFASPSELPRVGATCRVFHFVARDLARRASRRLLRDSGGLDGGARRATCSALWCGGVAQDVEEAIYAATGRKIDAYYDRLRLSVANLVRNPALAHRLNAYELLPQIFACMDASAMLRPESAEERARLRERAIEAARRPQPRGDVRGLYVCLVCGSLRQHLRRHTLAGLVDKYSETLVCVECRAVVPLSSRAPQPSDADTGGGAQAAGESAPKRLREAI